MTTPKATEDQINYIIKKLDERGLPLPTYLDELNAEEACYMVGVLFMSPKQVGNDFVRKHIRHAARRHLQEKQRI